ncbi:MAG: DMT family transporter [Spirochaetales bacterium]|nr:DMT family transporter [Spirochaetales bacterium]
MWITLTLLAALLQTIRNYFSKRVSVEAGTGIASLSRFLFGAPIAGVVCLVLQVRGFTAVIDWQPYLVTCAGMALFQVLANVFLIDLFRHKNFALSMTLIKTETLFVAFMGIYALGEVPGVFGWTGIFIASCGLAVSGGIGEASRKKKGGFRAGQLLNLPSLLALGAGASLALCTIFLKMSYAHISSPHAFYEVVITLFCIMVIQTFCSLFFVPPAQWRRLSSIIRRPGRPFLVGLCAVTASLCWFSAFQLQIAAYVRTLGQVEFIFGVLVSLTVLKERIRTAEFAGMACVTAGSVCLFL